MEIKKLKGFSLSRKEQESIKGELGISTIYCNTYNSDGSVRTTSSHLSFNASSSWENAWNSLGYTTSCWQLPTI